MTDDRSNESAWSRFWFTPTPTTGYQALRVLSGLLFCCWLLSFLGHQDGFFSFRGWVDLPSFQEARRQENVGNLAPVGWSFLYLAGESRTAFQIMYWGSVAILAAFALGIATRLTGILTWIIVVSFLANPVTSYEGDYLVAILAFHMMIGHLFLGQWNGNLTLAERFLGSRRDFVFCRWVFEPVRGERPPSYAANWSLRLIQFHVAIIVVTSGLHKLQIDDWWSGAALWYPLHAPFATTIESIEREKPMAPLVLFVLSALQYAVLGWQIGFPAFAWRQGTWSRILLIGGAVIGWAGAGLLFKLPLFGPFYFIGCLSFLSADEWIWLKERVRSVFHRAPAANAVREKAAVKK